MYPDSCIFCLIWRHSHHLSHPAREWKSILLSFTYTPHSLVKLSTLFNSTIKSLSFGLLSLPYLSFLTLLLQELPNWSDLPGSVFPHLNQFFLCQEVSLFSTLLTTRFSCVKSIFLSVVFPMLFPQNSVLLKSDKERLSFEGLNILLRPPSLPTHFAS